MASQPPAPSSDSTDAAPLAPLCGHDPQRLRAKGHRLRCDVCGSFFDRAFARRAFVYDASYPGARRHFDPEVGALKVRSLQRWLRAAGLDPSGQVVCEVGFGGGHCLRWLAARGAQAFGIEAVEANLAHARALGVADVRAFGECREPLPRPVQLWLFLDSFEHLPEPSPFLDWLVASSSPRARLLLVAPEAGSWSERWLGRLWPHRLPDHGFHYSRQGIEALLGTRGFRRVAAFRPTKSVSGAMLLAHLAHRFPALRAVSGASRWLGPLRIDFNLGEMGLVFERRAAAGPEAGALR